MRNATSVRKVTSKLPTQVTLLFSFYSVPGSSSRLRVPPARRPWGRRWEGTKGSTEANLIGSLLEWNVMVKTKYKPYVSITNGYGLNALYIREFLYVCSDIQDTRDVKRIATTFYWTKPFSGKFSQELLVKTPKFVDLLIIFMHIINMPWQYAYTNLNCYKFYYNVYKAKYKAVDCLPRRPYRIIHKYQ